MALSDISLRHGNSVAFGAKPTSSDFRCAPNLHAFDPDLHDSRLVSRSDVAEAKLFDPPETSRNRNGHQQLHDEFHTLDMNAGWEVPAGYPSGIQQKILIRCI